MATIGLLFGSFNPVHTGHLIVAEYFVSTGICDRVELVVSPQNPLKKEKQLAPESHRLQMARLAVRGNPWLSVNPIEFKLPKPSYTYETLRELRRQNAQDTYRLIIGSDNFDQFRKWKNWELILDEFRILAYRRPGFAGSELEHHRHVRVYDNVPLLHISATYIRNSVWKSRSVRYLVPEAVRKYIIAYGLYV